MTPPTTTDAHAPSHVLLSPPLMWRYTAVDLRKDGSQRVQQSGEMVGATPADVRGALRRIGLQVIDLKPVRRSHGKPKNEAMTFTAPFVERLHYHLRRRRGAQRAELYDGLATMLSAGIPLLEAIQTQIDSRQSSSGWTRSMLINVREQLRSGQSLAEAMHHHSSWFDELDVAIVEAGQHGGHLSEVLVSMAHRQQKADELGHKVIGALAYPFLVLIVGLGVSVFLSVKTLPQLAKILDDAKIPAPQLTRVVMWCGQTLANQWMWISLMIVAVIAATILAPPLLRRVGITIPIWSAGQRRVGRGLGLQVLRTLAVSGLAMRLAELLRSGVPMVDAIRMLAPTASSARLRGALIEATERIERGEELSDALNDERWFDAEFRRLLDVGQTTGELEPMLQRLGERFQRQAQRLIDRLSTLMEPVVILCLAALVGLVVMAAILPLLRLQEILR